MGGGNEAPALTGDRFLAKWSNHSLDELFESLRATMPADRPGTLSRPTTADILAYIFAANKFQPGGGELSSQSEALKQIRFEDRVASEPKLLARVGGTAPAAAASPSVNPKAEPSPARVDGQPIERRPPEKSDDKPGIPRADPRALSRISALQGHDADRQSARALEPRVPAGRQNSPHRTGCRAAYASWTPKASLSEPVAGVAELASPAAKDIGAARRGA